jgi:hypothetical protein
MESFSVRCIFRCEPRAEQTHKYLYEERITLWRASEIDEAIGFAESEASTYASEPGSEYLGYCQAYALFDEVQANGVEVFSLLRDSDLEPTQYLDTFFDAGSEREYAVQPLI